MSALVKTTLSAAVAVGDKQIKLASLTGVNAYNPLTKTAASLLYVDEELMRVETIDDTTNHFVTVARGVEGLVTAHASAAVVWIGDPTQFTHADKAGYEASPAQAVIINTAKGVIFYNIDGYWNQAKAGHVPIITGIVAPTNATTGAAVLPPGSLYVDVVNAKMYMNVGTLALPYWLNVGNMSS